MDSIFLYKDENGQIQRATAGEPIAREVLQEGVNKATNELHQWTAALTEYDRLSAPEKPSNKPADKPETQLLSQDDGDGHIKFTKPDTAKQDNINI